MSALIAVRALRTAINQGTVPWSRAYASSPGKGQQNKGTGGDGGGVAEGASSSAGVQIKNPDPPTSVFKSERQSKLGPGATKDGEYKNPEYFQYHNMSYAEMEIVMAELRVPQPSSKR